MQEGISVEDPKINKYKTAGGKAGYRIRWDHGSRSFSDAKRENVAEFKSVLMAHGMRDPRPLGLWPRADAARPRRPVRVSVLISRAYMWQGASFARFTYVLALLLVCC